MTGLILGDRHLAIVGDSIVLLTVFILAECDLC